ncbi:metallophosphoesterase [Candidatus Uhrbacteria bacterium CG10_big_fil_rev_8_21_14_0_10_50_16]|uniref:Metallophosphoesterase n=1 Tax=Candidatus Uhrbacteria bacterium CG10_big_fil_rev_8_21_14_0_10_50_16 TaxID=1975039 RepID=A0A2H0RQJ4_9BACT|nr:MAG: metallophosphoesterase [Candidatus Uhrbacteria bacterium CG10_big_fil_rev_8_21_14_0_10_50_16]
MQILAIADRPPDQPIKTILLKHAIDVIVTLGDLEQQQIYELEQITDIPKLGVYGNHCSGMYMTELGIENMHLRTLEIDGVTFGGFEGCVRYKNTSAKMYTQEESIELLRDFSRVDVMLCHAPPFGVNDEPDDSVHAGYKGLREYVEQKAPGYLLHGHTYPKEDALVTQLGSTQIVYVFGSKVITISK